MPYFSRHLQVKLLGLAGPEPPRRPLGRFPGPRLSAAILAAACLAGCSTPNTPPAADVGVDQAWHDARLVAGREKGGRAVAGTGTSMEPLYGDNTMLVITPIAYDRLRPGMIVAYISHTGVRVVHQLVQKKKDGWRVKGLNNEVIDRELVTPKNLIGVIYASFNYETDTSARK
jgi:Peptidase S24-like